MLKVFSILKGVRRQEAFFMPNSMVEEASCGKVLTY
jgi:hypothetical protein